MSPIVLYMFLVIFIGNLYVYIQAYKILKNKSTKNISMEAFAVSLFAQINWFIYGVYIGNPVIIFSSTMLIIGCILVMSIIFLLK